VFIDRATIVYPGIFTFFMFKFVEPGGGSFVFPLPHPLHLLIIRTSPISLILPQQPLYQHPLPLPLNTSQSTTPINTLILCFRPGHFLSFYEVFVCGGCLGEGVVFVGFCGSFADEGEGGVALGGGEEEGG